MSTTNPYAALARLPASTFKKWTQPAYNSGDVYAPESEILDLDGSIFSGDRAQFQSKYNFPEDLGNGRYALTFQAPGGHKYDTLRAEYTVDPVTGEYVMQGQPVKTRQISSGEKLRDATEEGVPFVAAVLGGAYGLSTMAGGAAAGSSASAAGKSGLDAYYLTGAVEGSTLGGAAAGGGAAGAVGAGSVASTLAGPIEAGLIGSGSGAPTMAGSVPAGSTAATGGGTVGSSTFTSGQVAGAADKLAAGAQGMSTFGDWVNLGGLVASVANRPKTPDTSGLNAAAEGSLQLSRDSFDWFKSEWEKTAPDRAAATKRDGEIGDAQLEAMKFATGEAKAAADRNRTVFQPIEDKLVADAAGFDTPERRAAAVAEATADVEGAFGRAQQGNQRALARMSVTPSASASAALMQDAALAKAKATAGATASATRNVEQQGYARTADAAALGKGVVSNQATQQQIATSAGSAGVNAGAGQVAAVNSGIPYMQGGTSAALNGLSTAGTLFGQAAGLTAQTRGQDLNLLSNAFNSYLKTSDEGVKKNTGDVTDGEEELAQINATPVEEGWSYDPAKGGPDDGGRKHTGPMAQSVRAKMGEKAAPGGKVIDMREVGGKLMAATQALSREVTEIKRTLARMSPAVAEAA